MSETDGLTHNFFSDVESAQKQKVLYGRLDKNTSLQELETNGFPVPPVFDTLEESQEWRASGGIILARPYFDAPWDSAIFLPGLQSKPLMMDGYYDVEVEKYQQQWNTYIQDLWQDNNLQGYLKEYGVLLTQPPQVSFILQGCVYRGTNYDYPITSTALLMDNDERTHIEWQTTGVPAHSGVYLRNQYSMLEPFSGFPMEEDGDGAVSATDILDLHRQVVDQFGQENNIQVEIAYGILKPGDKPQPYIVQARDFPQMNNPLWNYNIEYGKSVNIFNEGTYENFPKEFRGEHVRAVHHTRNMQNVPPYVLAVEQYGWINEDLIHPFINMKHLWIQGRWSRVPLMHGLFSLIELAHLRGGSVVLG